MPARLNVGLVGLGRLGSVYAQNLAHRVPNARLAAAADEKPGVRDRFTAELPGVKIYPSHQELLQDADVEAVVVVSSTSTHRQVVIAAAAARKAIFCEKPLSLSLAGACDMLHAVEALVFSSRRRSSADSMPVISRPKRKWTMV